MVVPAITYKDEIIQKIQKLYYSEDMMFLCGCLDNWVPNIEICPDGSRIQLAIINDSNTLIGYLGYSIDWYSSCAYNFGVVSFDKGNILVGKALFDELEKLINEYKLHRIELRMIEGNPIEKHYDSFCKKYNGTKHVLRDVFRDKQGNYHNDNIYEIIM